MAVHDVDMDDVGAGLHDGADLLAELGEIAGENGRPILSGRMGAPWKPIADFTPAPRPRPQSRVKFVLPTGGEIDLS